MDTIRLEKLSTVMLVQKGYWKSFKVDSIAKDLILLARPRRDDIRRYRSLVLALLAPVADLLPGGVLGESKVSGDTTEPLVLVLSQPGCIAEDAP
jgi:hypothetical protein